MLKTFPSNVAAHWDDNADQWTQDVRKGYDTYREHFTFPAFKAFLPDILHKRLLDFGCGEGTNTRRFAQMGAQLTGIDVSAGMIEHARRQEAEDPLGISYHIANYSDHTPLAAASFDGIVSTMALMDGPDLAGAMAEAYRLLRPGGFLAFSVLHPCFIVPGVNWSYQEGQEQIGFGTARYFERETFVENWKFGSRPKEEVVHPFSVPRFPRTMSDYLNAIADAGFRLTRIEEPRPTDEACQKVPRLARWRDLVAFLLMVQARKP